MYCSYSRLQLHLLFLGASFLLNYLLSNSCSRFHFLFSTLYFSWNGIIHTGQHRLPHLWLWIGSCDVCWPTGCEISALHATTVCSSVPLEFCTQPRKGMLLPFGCQNEEPRGALLDSSSVHWQHPGSRPWNLDGLLVFHISSNISSSWKCQSHLLGYLHTLPTDCVLVEVWDPVVSF